MQEPDPRQTADETAVCIPSPEEIERQKALLWGKHLDAMRKSNPHGRRREGMTREYGVQLSKRGLLHIPKR